MVNAVIIALDESVRHYDANGFLHVQRAAISKATVNPYYGREIPNYQSLGLESEEIYMLLRHPDELAAAADTCNNLQLMDLHHVSTADDPKKDKAVGSLGTDAVFEDPYLFNSLAIYDGDLIAAVESGEQKQISMAYQYTPDMTPGNYKGLRYDGIMRQIRFNHAALVPEGRAGPDVVIGDAKMLKSPRVLMAKGALAMLCRPIIAKDAKVDLDTLLKGVNAANFSASKAGIVKKLTKALDGKVTLAADASLPNFSAALDMVEKETCDEDPDDKEAEDGEPDDKEAEDGEPDDKEAEDGEPDDRPAEDARPRQRRQRDRQPAMDAKSIKTAEDNALSRFRAIRRAEAEVRPVVGELAEMLASDAAVYKYALDKMDVETDGVPDSAFGPLFRSAVRTYGQDSRPAPRAKVATGLSTHFAGVRNIRRG